MISQNIDAGEKVDKDTTISYVVSKGPETKYVKVPNLYGMTESQARQALRDAGLSVGEVNDDYISSSNVNRVVEQSISRGTSVEEGTSVSFTVNLGLEPEPEPSEPEPEQPSESQDPETDTGTDVETGAESIGSGVNVG